MCNYNNNNSDSNMYQVFEKKELKKNKSKEKQANNKK